MASEIWIIDDEPSICWALRKALESEGHRVSTFSNGEAFLHALEDSKAAPDAAFLDVRLPGISGIEALSRAQTHRDGLPIIVMTAFGDLKTAVDAVQSKAFDYMTKPFALDAALDVVRRALRGGSTNRTVPALPIAELSTGDGALGMSTKMQDVYRQIAIAASHDGSVLIVGEQGVGKSTVCRLIHAYSQRSGGPILTFRPNPADSLECQSELFGTYSASAYSHRGDSNGGDSNGGDSSRAARQPAGGRLIDRPGLLQLGAAGSVVIDEVLRMPVNQQAKLLEAIESQSYMAVDSNTRQPLTARLMFTSTTPLSSEMDETELYMQLRSHLSLHVIHVPSLAERPEDIPQLVDSLLHQLSGEGSLTITPEAMQELQRRKWPLNLRQLNQAIQMAASRCTGDTIRIDDLAAAKSETPAASQDQSTTDDLVEAVERWARQRCQDPAQGITTPPDGFVYDECLQIIERSLFESVLKVTDGNRAKAADILGIHRTTLRQKSKRLGIE